MMFQFHVLGKLLWIVVAISQLFFSTTAIGFTVYDALSYTNKPDTSAYGIQPISVETESTFCPGGCGANLPEQATVCSVAAAQTTLSVVDIEAWDSQTEAGRTKYVTVLQWYDACLPGGLKFGHYAIPPKRNYWSAQEAPSHPDYIAWQAQNDFLIPIANENDMHFPSVYTFYTDQDGWVLYATRNVQEARRVGGYKEAHAFIMTDYHTCCGESGPIPEAYWRLQLDTLRVIADGVVLWGGYLQEWNEEAGWWTATKAFMDELNYSTGSVQLGTSVSGGSFF